MKIFKAVQIRINPKKSNNTHETERSTNRINQPINT